MFLNLRSAFSAMCGIFCLLLIALAVRSYSARDALRGSIGGNVLNVQSLRGELGIGFYRWPYKRVAWSTTSQTDNMEALWPPVKGKPPLSWLGIRRLTDGNEQTFVIVPLWLVVVIVATLAALPWSRWPRRFSVRR
jgi:hypothetical protein